MAKQYKVRLSPSAKPDLKGIAEWIIDQSGHIRAASIYVRRIRTYLTGFKNFPIAALSVMILFPLFGLSVLNDA